MSFSTAELLGINLARGGRGFRDGAERPMIDRLAVINVIPDRFERAAYLAMVLIDRQPFKDANHRTTATAIARELGALTVRTEAEIETWLRTGHERNGGLGLDVTMGQESDTGPVNTAARMALIRFLGG
ncbi:MAG: hypothetical protein KDH15_21940 [Rhodocyclaceae bacterium]|nr:hypothetical protein [Rhodocyclaceae bacterium]